MTREEFKKLLDEWYHDTMFHSNPTMINAHPNVQKLIEGGKKIIPLIMEDIENGPTTHWFNILEKITGFNMPIRQSEAGRIEVIHKKWKKWYEDEYLHRGYLSLSDVRMVLNHASTANYYSSITQDQRITLKRLLNVLDSSYLIEKLTDEYSHLFNE